MDGAVEASVKVRDRIVEAWTFHETARLRMLVKSACQLVVSKEVLATSGLTYLLRDQDVRSALDGTTLVLVDTTLKKWRTAYRLEEDIPTASRKRSRPMGGLSGRGFLENVEALESWLKDINGGGHNATDSQYRHVASRLALSRFSSWRQLEGVQHEDVVHLCRNPAELAVMRMAVDRANDRAVTLRRIEASVGQGRQNEVALPMAVRAGGAASSAQPDGLEVFDAQKVVKLLTNEAVAEAEVYWQNKTAEDGLAGFGEAVPRRAIGMAANAVAAGADVRGTLAAKAQLLRIETQRKSLASVVSGLRAWHNFAVGVLKYPADRSLPPLSDDDVCAFVTLFSSPGTASNYVGYIRWTCHELRVGVSWDTTRVGRTIKGLGKLNIKLLGGTLPQKWRLSQASLQAVVSMADAIGSPDWAVLALVSWEFLLRVQSEGIPLQHGAPEELAVLPAGRHSTLFIDGENAAVLRLRVRKHRPRGSVLRRPCRCDSVPAQFCCACRYRSWCKAEPRAVGQRVFGGSAYAFQQELRRLLVLTGELQGAQFTLKCFRAGRATELAKQGGSWQSVLAAGEWRGLAALKYLDIDAVDESAYMKAVLEASSESEVS